VHKKALPQSSNAHLQHCTTANITKQQQQQQEIIIDLYSAVGS